MKLKYLIYTITTLVLIVNIIGINMHLIRNTPSSFINFYKLLTGDYTYDKVSTISSKLRILYYVENNIKKNKLLLTFRDSHLYYFNIPFLSNKDPRLFKLYKEDDIDRFYQALVDLNIEYIYITGKYNPSIYNSLFMDLIGDNKYVDLLFNINSTRLYRLNYKDNFVDKSVKIKKDLYIKKELPSILKNLKQMYKISKNKEVYEFLTHKTNIYYSDIDFNVKNFNSLFKLNISLSTQKESNVNFYVREYKNNIFLNKVFVGNALFKGTRNFSFLYTPLSYGVNGIKLFLAVDGIDTEINSLEYTISNIKLSDKLLFAKRTIVSKLFKINSKNISVEFKIRNSAAYNVSVHLYKDFNEFNDNKVMMKYNLGNCYSDGISNYQKEILDIVDKAKFAQVILQKIDKGILKQTKEITHMKNFGIISNINIRNIDDK